MGDIHATVMDYEEGWGDLVEAMDQSTRNLLCHTDNDDGDGDDEEKSVLYPSMSCDWGGKCDITKSIVNDSVNARCLQLLRGDTAAKLWICQYCVAENAELLRDSDYIFLKELVQEMPDGTLLLLTEVVPRLWPEMVRMLKNEGLLETTEVGFLKGYHGKQFLLRKNCRGTASAEEAVGVDDSPFASLDDRTRDQLEHFEKLASYHERKLDSGWERQGRKENGSIYNEQRQRAQRLQK